MTPDSPASAKGALRERMRAARSALDPAVRASASRAIAARVAVLPAWTAARTVALYAAMGAEVETAELARLAEADGKRVAWPRLAGAERAMEFAIASPGDLVPGPAKAPEPPPGSPVVSPAEIDLILVPGLAFDEAGGRLGRGRGHYDATLAGMRPGAARVGIAFECQVVERVPSEPHDVALDAVVTESRVRARPPGGRAG
ncbi:MAG TPA: 5-formyltetrahydrofolate cyclo-ligase [Anaeromyxobacteraceae bacterium]|nr:5-formyltetrahydrofolate cyclo-ligase [Anaeromyxobacteraceae bacterium]